MFIKEGSTNLQEELSYNTDTDFIDFVTERGELTGAFVSSYNNRFLPAPEGLFNPISAFAVPFTSAHSLSGL